MFESIDRVNSSIAGALKFLTLMLITAPGAGVAGIIWNGDFSTGDLLQYHHREDDTRVMTLKEIPPHGRPIQYGGQSSTDVGDGSLLSLVSVDGRKVNGIYYPQGPTRGASPYTGKFTVKPLDDPNNNCDGSNCTRRRTQLKLQTLHPDYYNAIPHMAERWVSFSIFLPEDWPASGTGWGPVIMGIKQRQDSYAISGLFGIDILNNTWTVRHRWHPEQNASDMPWQHGMFYSGNYDGQPYPRANFWPDGLADFPDVSTSHAALQSLNKGGWTDWILHWRQDHRGTSAAGPSGQSGANPAGSGFLTLWKREDDGPWIKVLHILPKWTTRGGMTFNHGIGYNLSAFSGSDAGSGGIIGQYMDNGQVPKSGDDRVIYIANFKVGDERASFSDMSPDGSTPDSGHEESSAPPKAPELNPLE